MNSDKNKMKQLFQNGKHFAMAVAVMLMATTVTMAQDLIVIAGSVHSFSVTDNPNNDFMWTYHDETFASLDGTYIDYISGQSGANVTVRFTDNDYLTGRITYLAVTESRRDAACSTTRALQILVQPNNMYFDFAQLPNADDCYNYDATYFAEVQVGMNFNDRNGPSDMAIPEDRFPLNVKYSVENITDGIVVVSEKEIIVEYNELNMYVLEIPEAVGRINETIEYELTINEVIDSQQALVKHDVDRRLQIRIMNHLPQSGSMDMAMAYTITPVMYNGIY
jgi:hypothetical protein